MFSKFKNKEYTFIDLLKLLLRYWFLILIPLLIGGSIGAGLYFTVKDTSYSYTTYIDKVSGNFMETEIEKLPSAVINNESFQKYIDALEQKGVHKNDNSLFTIKDLDNHLYAASSLLEDNVVRVKLVSTYKTKGYAKLIGENIGEFVCSVINEVYYKSEFKVRNDLFVENEEVFVTKNNLFLILPVLVFTIGGFFVAILVDLKKDRINDLSDLDSAHLEYEYINTKSKKNAGLVCNFKRVIFLDDGVTRLNKKQSNKLNSYFSNSELIKLSDLKKKEEPVCCVVLSKTSYSKLFETIKILSDEGKQYKLLVIKL